MKLQPLADRVVLKELEEEEETTESGIVIPEEAQEQPQQAEVVAVGPGKQENGHVEAPDVDEGDTVIHSKYSGTEVTVDGEEFLVVESDDILARIE